MMIMPSDKVEQEIETIVASIKRSKKYRDVYEGTIRELVRSEFGKHKRKVLEKAVRKRLHRIVAPYVGDPNYKRATIELETAFESGERETVREVCARILSSHASARERLQIVDRFYKEIFDITGKPDAILDIACALNPLTFPWMDLPSTLEYHAYDIHETRVEFINTFFSLQGLPTFAKVQDVAFDFPQETADVAFFLKELHRFEQNYAKRGLALLDALRARYLVVSFPTVSLHSGRSLTERYRQFFPELITGRGWAIEEIEFETELVFCVDKGLSADLAD